MICTWGATGGLKPAMDLNLLSGAISSLVSFTRATTGTVTDFEGLIKNVKSGEVRFDGMRRVENLLTYSQAIGGTGWTSASATTTLNSTIAPDGTQTASLTTISAQFGGAIQVVTLAASTTYVLSVWVLANTGNNSLNLQVGANISSSFVPTNTWTRKYFTFTNTTAGAYNLYAVIDRNVSGFGSVYIWGAQLENVTGQTNQNPSEYVSTNASGSGLLNELVINGDFSNGLTSWGNTSTGGGTASVSAGQLSLTRPLVGDSAGITQAPAISGFSYQITFTVVSGTAFVSISPYGGNYSAGTYTLSWFAVGATSLFIQNPTAGTTCVVDNISVKQINLPAAVDGVQYFPYTNPNCIINGAITQIPTIAINSSNSKFAYNCVASGDYFSTPSSTANQITGDISLLVQVALDDWTPATVQTLVAKDGVSAGTRSWALNIQTSGAPRLNYSLDGTTIISVTASASTGFTDGTTHFVGVQREAATGIIRFYTSENGTTFTLLGTQQTGTAGSLYNATSTQVQFGSLASSGFDLFGKIYDSHVYAGLKFTGSSTMVMDFDPSNWTSGSTFTGLETGEVWTLNGNAKIYQGLWDAVGPKSLLIEEQRVNLCLYSQDWTNAAWLKTNITLGASGIAPDGTLTAARIQATASVATLLKQHINAAATTQTYSIYAKQGSGVIDANSFAVYNNTTATNLAVLSINYGTGVVTQTIGTGATATAAGNGFWRIVIPVTSGITVADSLAIYPCFTGNAETAGEYAYVWGAQLE